MSDPHTTAGRWPDFLVIGAGRAGTTSLHRYLARHPDVFLPKTKAPSHWYAVGRPGVHDLPASFVRSETAYRALFADSERAQVCGEVSPVYLAATDVAAKAVERMPDIRVVAILRHPVDRVYARWVARRRDGLEAQSTFEALIDAEAATLEQVEDAHATYLAGGIVSPMLHTWFDLIPADRRLVLWFEDFARDTAGVMRTVCDFIGVNPSLDLGTAQAHNASGGRIRNPLLRAAWAGSYPLRRLVRPFMPAVARDAAFRLATRGVSPLPLATPTRARLTALYADEIRALGALTGRDLSAWLEPAAAGMRRA